MSTWTKSFLVDVNVWVAVAHDLHVHHTLVWSWFETVGLDQAFFCRLTQLGLLRLLTNPRVMGPHVMTQLRAWQAFDELHQDLRVSFLTELPHVELSLRQLTDGSGSGPNVWSDAYLGAVARAAGLTVVTMDRAFAKMPGVEALILRER
jgi:toxin-antitoxin system PIN domain toxin